MNCQSASLYFLFLISDCSICLYFFTKNIFSPHKCKKKGGAPVPIATRPTLIIYTILLTPCLVRKVVSLYLCTSFRKAKESQIRRLVTR